MSRVSLLQSDLKQWARWVETQIDAHAGTTPIGRSMAGQPYRDAPALMTPNIDPTYDWLKRLTDAMKAACTTPKKARYVEAVQLYYLHGPERTRDILGKPDRTLRDWRKWGEALIAKNYQ